MLIALIAAFALVPDGAPESRVQANGAAEAAAPVSHETAAALARTVAPADVVVTEAISQIREAFLALPASDDDFRQMERDYPGVLASVWNEIQPEMRKALEADNPAFWGALEKLYREDLTETEARALLTFYRSTTGQKMLRTAYASVDLKPVLSELVKSEPSVITAGEMHAIGDAARAKAAQSVDASDVENLRRLTEAIKLDRVRAVGAETQKLMLEWINKDNPQFDARLAELMRSAMDHYIAAHPLKK